MEDLLKLKQKSFNIMNNTVLIKEQTLFKANGEEGLHLWESSIALARWCLQNKLIFESKSVVELGSGCGLLGIAIAKYVECKEIVLTDYNDAVLENLKENISLNIKENKPITIMKLDWTSECNDNKTYDIVIGSELIYKGGPIKELVKTIKRLLSKEGICILSMPKKRMMTELFTSYIEEENLQIEGALLDSKEIVDEKISNNQKENKLFEPLNKEEIMIYNIKHK